MKRVTIESNGRRLSAALFGEGLPVVCLSGLAGVSDDWALLADDLASTHSVVAVDLPGCGWADSGDERVSAIKEADRLADLLAQLNLPAATVIGHSMGGFVAEVFARRHPGLIQGLVLLDSSVENAPHPAAAHPRAEAIAARATQIVGAPLRRAADLALSRRAHLPIELSRNAAATLRRPETARGAVTWWCSYQPMAQEVLEQRRIRPLTTPTQVVAATRRARQTRWVAHQRELADTLDASFQLIRGSGHRVHLERPDAVAALLACR